MDSCFVLLLKHVVYVTVCFPFISGAGLAWIFSVLFMFLTFLLFLFGYPLHKFVCEPLTDPEYGVFRTVSASNLSRCVGYKCTVELSCCLSLMWTLTLHLNSPVLQLIDEPDSLLSKNGYFMGELVFNNGSINLTVSGVLE